MRSTMFGAAVLSPTAAPAHAAAAASSLAYNAGQNMVVCYLYNAGTTTESVAGTTTESVTSVQIIREHAGSVGPLGPHDCNSR